MWITDQTPPATTTPPPVPPHPGEGRWKLFVQRGWSLYWADSWEDVLDGLMRSDTVTEGSPDAESSAWILDVAKLLDAVVATTQAEINYNASLNGKSVSEEEWMILRAPKFPHPDIERWESHVPLVLLAQEYEPYSAIPPPKGNILWVESLGTSDAEGVVRSLERLGYLSVEDISDIAS